MCDKLVGSAFLIKLIFYVLLLFFIGREPEYNNVPDCIPGVTNKARI